MLSESNGIIIPSITLSIGVLFFIVFLILHIYLKNKKTSLMIPNNSNKEGFFDFIKNYFYLMLSLFGVLIIIGSITILIQG